MGEWGVVGSNAKKANKKPLRGGTFGSFSLLIHANLRGSGQVHRGINQPYYGIIVSTSNLTLIISRLKELS